MKFCLTLAWLCAGLATVAHAGYYKSTTCTNSGNAYTVNPENSPTSYVNLDVIVFRASATNTGAATLQFGSLGAKSICKLGSSTALSASDILLGKTVMCVYQSTAGVFEILNEQSGEKHGRGSQYYMTAGQYNFIWPDGVQKVWVTVWGAGGSGGGSQNVTVGGAPGGGAGCATGWVARPAGGSTGVICGTGGASITANSTANGNAGGTSQFGTTLVAYGGAGGESAANGGIGGSGGYPSGSDIIGGYFGSYGQSITASEVTFAMGGIAGGGGGGGGCNGAAGTQPGGGGSGGYSTIASGAGADGEVEVTW